MFLKVLSPNPGLYHGPCYTTPTAILFPLGGREVGKEGEPEAVKASILSSADAVSGGPVVLDVIFSSSASPYSSARSLSVSPH